MIRWIRCKMICSYWTNRIHTHIDHMTSSFEFTLVGNSIISYLSIWNMTVTSFYFQEICFLNMFPVNRKMKKKKNDAQIRKSLASKWFQPIIFSSPPFCVWILFIYLLSFNLFQVFRFGQYTNAKQLASEYQQLFHHSCGRCVICALQGNTYNIYMLISVDREFSSWKYWNIVHGNFDLKIWRKKS